MININKLLINVSYPHIILVPILFSSYRRLQYKYNNKLLSSIFRIHFVLLALVQLERYFTSE